MTTKLKDLSRMFDRDHYALVLHTQRSFASATSAPTEKTMVFGIVTRYNNNNKKPPLLCTGSLTACFCVCLLPSPAALTCSSTLPATAPLAAQLQAQLLVAVQVQVQALSKMEQSDTSTVCGFLCSCFKPNACLSISSVERVFEGMHVRMWQTTFCRTF